MLLESGLHRVQPDDDHPARRKSVIRGESFRSPSEMRHVLAAVRGNEDGRDVQGKVPQTLYQAQTERRPVGPLPNLRARAQKGRRGI